VEGDDRVYEEEASEIRDRELGREIYLTAHIHMVTPCRLSPPCKYCSISSSIARVRRLRETLTDEELVKNVKGIEKKKEITSITLVGGSDIKGQGDLLIDVVKKVRNVTGIDVSIDVGAPISIETLQILKEEGVTAIYSSLETVNRHAFNDAKPGDSLDLRIKLLHDASSAGIPVGTIIMNGLGSESDVMKSIDFMQRFLNIKYIYISTFNPVRGTPWENRQAASINDSLRYIAYARHKLRNAHIGLADVETEGNAVSGMISRELSVGGGNTLAGMLIYKTLREDYVDNLLRLEKRGYEIVRRE
jgi:biotin synthase